MRLLSDITFDDSFVRELPGDPSRENKTRQVTGACYSFVDPTPVTKPELIAWSKPAAALLELSEPQDSLGLEAQVFGGNKILPSMKPFAACYGGHQFGAWADQLGDGRAISLGEIVNSQASRWEVQLKGPGPTPYSRRGDGRAVLRSSIREFICSEAMHHLRVPTTRALCLVKTGDWVVRDMFYDGNPEREPGAIVTRLSPSFVRFGNFEILRARDDVANLRLLADYVIEKHFPDIAHIPSGDSVRYVNWFSEVSRRTAVMISHWMALGFVHGVMNTDNMSVLGLTIDYGPFGWLDSFDPNFTPNTTDYREGRYRFGNQPRVALWNLDRFATALAPLVSESAHLDAALDLFTKTFEEIYRQIMSRKLGISLTTADGENGGLLTELMGNFFAAELDQTIFFRRLSSLPLGKPSDDVLMQWLHPSLYISELPNEQREVWLRWLRTYSERIASDPASLAGGRSVMNQNNPWIIPRNYLLQEAIDAAHEGNNSKILRLLAACEAPFTENPVFADLGGKRPEWALDKAGCSALSCSS